MKVKIQRNQYSSHFKDVLLSEHRYLVCFGSRGSGKTNHIILKLLSLTYLSEHINIVYCRNEKTTIRDTTFKDIYNYIENSPFKDDFEYSKAYNSSMIFRNKYTKKELSPFGLTDEENTKGISEATHVWIDEVNKCSQNAVTMINSVLRTPKARVKQLIVSFNPIDKEHWLRKFFFDENDPYKAHPRFNGDILIHHSTLEHNEYINKEEYRQTLMLNYAHNQNLLDVNLYGLWGKAEVEAPFAQRFDKTKHVKKLEYKGKVYRLSFDFNVNPITCIIATDNGKKAQILKEFRLSDSDIYKLCSEIRSWLPIGCYIEVTGDSTGSNRSAMTQGNINYYDIIEKELRISRRQIRTPTYNIGHENSRALMNSLFIENLIELDESCKWLIDDLVYCEVLPDGHINKKKNEASNMGHLLDCLRYLLATFYNTRK